MSEDQKVQLLLVEHKTLRDEIIARTNHGYQLVTFGASGVTLLVSLGDKTHLLFGATALLIVVLSAACFFMHRDISKASQRIREIEIDINQRIGEDILVWENLWGSARTGIFGRARPPPRSTLTTLPKPTRTLNGRHLLGHSFASDVQAPSEP